MTPKKPKVGIYSVTGCMGCQLNILFQEDLLQLLDYIDLAAFPGGLEKNDDESSDFDIIFMEGVVVNENEIEFVKKIRDRTKMLVAIGACATDGCVPAIKNFTDKCAVIEATYKNVKHNIEEIQKNLKSVDPAPIDKFVKVDYYIRGCPMDKVEFLKFMKTILMGKEFKAANKPICHTCMLQENGCLLDQGRECLGPVTIGDCSVMCPHFNHPCIGCRGPFPDANFHAYFDNLLKRGIDPATTMQRLNKYAGLKFKEMIEKQFETGEHENKDEKKVTEDMYCRLAPGKHDLHLKPNKE
ncbi:hypothetical protein JW868_02045 [Candidatus Woesearchaeota archaeon]|nr:hypothetical protein [Candidatus Woesearchaeota archaeon]